MSHKKKSKYHNRLLIAGWIIAALAVIFMLWQRNQLPHEAFTTSTTVIKTDYKKKPQPKLPNARLEFDQ